MNREKLQELMREKDLTDPLERASFIYGFRTAEKMKGNEMKKKCTEERPCIPCFTDNGVCDDLKIGNQVEEVLQWFKLAVPEPTTENKSVQIGCHFEEVAEMAESLGLVELENVLNKYAKLFKEKDVAAIESIHCVNELKLLDATRDQCVTGIGVDYMFGFDSVGAQGEVNRSNFSKFVDGKPVFNAQGKIAKPDSYSPPVLDSFLGDVK